MTLEAIGHAGCGTAGRDIVCAGVSALLFGLAAYLEKMCEAEGLGHVEKREGEGSLSLRTRGMAGEDAKAFSVTAAGLELISHAFPEAVCFAKNIFYEEEKEWKRV